MLLRCSDLDTHNLCHGECCVCCYIVEIFPSLFKHVSLGTKIGKKQQEMCGVFFSISGIVTLVY